MKYCYFIISVQILQLTKSVLFPTPHEWDGCPDTDNLKIFSISTGIRPISKFIISKSSKFTLKKKKKKDVKVDMVQEGQ